MTDAPKDATAALARFDLPDGTHLSLHPSCLVHRGEAQLETVPLSAVQSLRVGFERNARRIRWAVILGVLAIFLFALSGPLALFAGGAAAEMAGSAQGVARALYILFRILEAIASLLPVLAAAAILGAGALGYFGWRGATVLEITLAGAERVYASRGRDAALLEFAASVAERLMAPNR